MCLACPWIYCQDGASFILSGNSWTATLIFIGHEGFQSSWDVWNLFIDLDLAVNFWYSCTQLKSLLEFRSGLAHLWPHKVKCLIDSSSTWGLMARSASSSKFRLTFFIATAKYSCLWASGSHGRSCFKSMHLVSACEILFATIMWRKTALATSEICASKYGSTRALTILTVCGFKTNSHHLTSLSSFLYWSRY